MVKSETAPPGASSSSVTEHKMRKKKYKGVRMRSWGSWVSEIRSPNQKTRIWLGSYATAEAAARAYDAALLCIKGSSASSILNFPISDASHYGIPHDGNPLMSPKSIQRAAAAAAASSGGVSGASAPSPSAPPPALSTSMDYSPSSMSYSSPLINQQHDDDVSPAEHNNRFHEIQASETMATVDSWCNFESPKYSDLMVNGAAFDAVSTASYMADDSVIEEGDIRLWSFC